MFLELQKAIKETKSTNTLPNLIVHEFKDVAKFRNEKPKWCLDYNPNGKVPTLIDERNDVIMWESCACCHYLLEFYDSNGLLLKKKNPKQRALYHQLACYSSGTVDNLTSTSSPIQRAVNEVQKSPADMNPLIKEENRIAWNTYCGPYYENLLEQSGGPFLFGNDFSAADVIFGLNILALHDKMITRGDGISWIDPKFQLLFKYHEKVFERPTTKLAFSQTSMWKGLIPDNIKVVSAVPYSDLK